MPRSIKWFLSLRFSNQNPVHASSLRIRATFPANLILLDLITRTIVKEINIGLKINDKILRLKRTLI
jgi:hypothetical protein